MYILCIYVYKLYIILYYILYHDMMKHLKTLTKLSDGAHSGAFGDARCVNPVEIFIESSPNGCIISRLVSLPPPPGFV